MNRYLKWTLITIGVLAVAFFAFIAYMMSTTKKHSPEETVNYNKNGIELSVFYNRPSKKGREIFGGLVPYGEVWRTGANEPTTFSTNKDLQIGNNSLPAGKYTLWTIPNESEWTVIFNEKMYDWGVTMQDFKIVTTREEASDVLQAKVPTNKLTAPVEMFTIKFEDGSGLNLVLEWDDTRVEVPLSAQ